MSPSSRSPRPNLPLTLIEECRKGECVLYVGGGLSAEPGGPTSQPFLKDLLDWTVQSKFVGKDLAQSYYAALKQHQIAHVADGVVSALQGREEALHKYLLATFSQESSLRPEYELITRIPFAAVITSNLDDRLEQAYASSASKAEASSSRVPGSIPRVSDPSSSAPLVYTPADREQLLDALHKRDYFILKLYGTLQRPETVMVAQTQLEDALKENIAFSQFMESLFFSRTLLFIGTSLQAIEDYLKSIALKRISNPREHFALVAVSGNAWQPAADSLERRYGIKILPMNTDPTYKDMLSFLHALKNEISPAGNVVDSSQLANDNQVPFLKSVKLDNIGPFDHLELEFDPRWNILLGDNGVGKSNILKAIAVALIGKDSQAFAGRLIKSGKTSSQILIETDRNSYKSEISYTSTEPIVNSNPPRPLESEGWLAMGFPPLRSVSWDRPKAPEAETKGRPTPDDLLPLIKGAPDPRLDKLKQWLVNLDYWIKNERDQKREGNRAGEGRYERLLKDFFNVVEVLTEGLTVQFKEVKPQTNEVTVITDDGEVPLEAISQGTTSLIGWVGILLQRLYEIYGDEPEPTKKYALVLMDEIDAHLHPAWQQSLVQKLRTLFPNVQFIATTHSPLIVGGMPAQQVFRFVRDDDGKVIQQPVHSEMTLGRADQILTGDLFGLKTTLDSITQDEIEAYKRLLGKTQRTPQEEKEFQRVRQVLQVRIPMPAETAAERQAQAEARDLALKQVRAASKRPTKTSVQKKAPAKARPIKKSMKAKKRMPPKTGTKKR
jgi:energy-coupling factor transporter ATP-binding protein EcfA2